MIILDSSTLVSAGRGTGLDLLRAIRRSGIDVGIPQMVVEELAAQQALTYSDAYAAATKAMESLWKATPWKTTASLADETDRVRAHWRNFYANLGEPLRPSQQVLEEALAREANAIAPCKRTGPEKRPIKVGGRDAVIWLTAVEYANTHKDETVYFVSGNTTDFGDGTDYRPPMDADLEKIRDRFKHLTSLDDVIAEFAQETNIDRSKVEETCSLGAVHDVVIRTAVDNWAMKYDVLSFGFAATAFDDKGGYDTRATGWLDPAGVEAMPLSLNDIRGYRIGGHEWAICEVSWELGGWVLHGEDDEFGWVSTRYDTRLLVSAESGTAAVLGDSEPRALDYAPVNRPKRVVDADKLRAALLALRSRTPLEKTVAYQLEGERRRHDKLVLSNLLESTRASANLIAKLRPPSEWNRWHDGPPL
ncbi:PIN domain-containing protein [Streptomyces sp. DH12]|uniref:PIN domain-containing protein n=1 Tax=Streptomyces sp. DH12 TaxID=2857010 RepID=UPI001E3FAFCC|nr:PIN domain-containing protein [Streptomyces sp. DH12]